MRSWLGAVRKLRTLFGRTEDAAPAPFPGSDALVSGEQAALATEALLADGIWRATVGAGTSARFDANDLRLPRNAFGGAVSHHVVGGGSDALAGAAGLAMTGYRAALFLSGERLLEAHGQLRAAVERHIPLVVHVSCDPGHGGASGPGNGHESVHAIADTGAVVFFAKNAQEAVDLTLIARAVAERALVPVVVAMDGPETAWGVQDVRLAGDEVVASLLGAPGDSIEAPTPAQSLLFGDTRRLVPRWFDADRPVALGASLGGDDLASALIGETLFFGAHVGAIIKQVRERHAALTGRPFAGLTRHRIEDADAVVIVQGAAVETAAALADHLRAERKSKVGVLGIGLVRPFPSAEVAALLRGARAVTVVERVDGALAQAGPLWQEVRAALAGSQTLVLAATAGLGGRPVTGAQLGAAFLQMEPGVEPRALLHLDLAPVEVGSRFPKREMVQQAVRRSYPDMERWTAQGPGVSLRPASARVVALFAGAADIREDAIEALAGALTAVAGGRVRSHATTLEQGVWAGRIGAASEPIGALDGPVEVSLVRSLDLPASVDPLRDLAKGGGVVFSTDLRGEELWRALRPGWRGAIRERSARLIAVSGGFDELVLAASALLGGGATDETVWAAFDDPSAPTVAASLPMAVRRFGERGAAYDSVPRFFGEVVEPRLGGEAPGTAPDPFPSLRVTPAGTATLRDRSIVRTHAPIIDLSGCTGCGVCWVGCPDAALAATALPIVDLLDAAAGRVRRETPDPSADKLRRAHKQLAGRLEGELAKAGATTMDRAAIDAAWEWLAGRMGVDGDERVAMQAALVATADELLRAPLAATRALFHEPHAAEKGTGALLSLVVNPQACQGCGVCAEECPAGVIEKVPQDGGILDGLRRSFAAWEELPETPGAVIARARDRAQPGPLPALLMSHACHFALAGGDASEPGSGERLATRLVVATTEYAQQRRTLVALREADDLLAALREKLRTALAVGIPTDRLDALDAALTDAQGKGAAAVLARLEEQGERTSIDRKAARRLVQAAQGIEALRASLAEGPTGHGRARFGLVATDGTVREWAASWPYNPFSVPLTMDLGGNAVEVARGVVEGLLSRRVDEARALRLARLALDAPSDVVARERALEDLRWTDLSDDELLLTPPLLLLAGAEGLSERALTGLGRLLASDLPVKVVLLDGRDLLAPSPDATLVAIAHRNAFVVAGSVAHSAHLFKGVEGAIAHPGPALLHLYAPSPRRHGFAAEKLLVRARAAVDGRVHPLAVYDPKLDGVFGRRLSLDGNPYGGAVWSRADDASEWTAAHWAVEETRYAPHVGADGGAPSLEQWAAKSWTERRRSPASLKAGGVTMSIDAPLARAVAERAERWRTLQELAGITSPFVDAVRAQVEAELRKTSAAEVAAAHVTADQRVAAAEQQQADSQVARLRDRLMALAGYDAGVPRG